MENEVIYQCVDGGIYEIKLDPNLKVLFDFVRDESHRFALVCHQKKINKKRSQSSLIEIKGVGEVLAKKLLHSFGSLQSLSRASAEEISLVQGVSEELAERIVEWFQR